MHQERERNSMSEVSRFDYRQHGVEFFFTRQQVPLGQTKPWGQVMQSPRQRALSATRPLW